MNFKYLLSTILLCSVLSVGLGIYIGVNLLPEDVTKPSQPKTSFSSIKGMPELVQGSISCSTYTDNKVAQDTLVNAMVEACGKTPVKELLDLATVPCPNKGVEI